MIGLAMAVIPSPGVFRNFSPPALLSVCKESYEVASKRYELAFASYHGVPRTWFDFSQDYLYLDWRDSAIGEEWMGNPPCQT